MLRARSIMSRRRGVAVVELAVVLPLMIMLLLGIWEIGRLVQIHQVVSNAAREGARQASAGQKSRTQVEAVVRDYLVSAGVPVDNLQVTLTNVTHSSLDPRDAEQLDKFRVHVSLPFSNVHWLAVDTFVRSDHRLQADAYWYSMKDKDFPDPPDPGIE